MKILFAALLLFVSPLFAQNVIPDAHRPEIMIVGTYHFVSKNNVHNMPVDDPMSPRRQKEISELVDHLARFQPTKIVLEETAGTSDLEKHYEEYRQKNFDLPASENYQIGFRLAKKLDQPRIFLINAYVDFDYPGLMDFAQKHQQTALIDKANALGIAPTQHMSAIQSQGTVLDLYRYLNSSEAINLNNSVYMYLARVGDADHPVGANVVGGWHLRILEMFAKLTRLIESPQERILVLYGQGHEYLLRDFVAQSPDLYLVDAEQYLH